MRLSQLAPQTFDLELVTPTGVDTGVVLKLVGMDSAQFMSGMKKLAQAKQQADASKKTLSIDQLTRLNAETLASCIVGWTGLEDEAGATLSYSNEKALEILLNPEYNWIREAIDGAVESRQNFFRHNDQAAE